MRLHFFIFARQHTCVLIQGICSVYGLFMFETVTSAMEIKGQIRAGAYSRSVTLEELEAGESKNDESVFSGQLRLDATEINSSYDQFLFEIRDKLDNFGKLERENLRLSSYNRTQLRHLAYQRPFEQNRFYFTLGRFTLSEANVLSHDGIEGGYRISKNTRIGVYAGQGAKDIITPLYVDPSTTEVPALQAGAYVTYDRKEGPEDNSYLTQAIGKAPSFDFTDSQDHTSYYQQGLWTFTRAHRLGSIVLFDVQPASRLRRGSLSYTYLTDVYRSLVYFQQSDTEDYFLKQTLQDTLVPSAVQSLNYELRQKTSSAFDFDYSFRFGRRAADGLTQDQAAFGILKNELFSKSAMGRLQVGVRRNFNSRDKFARLGYEYWSKNLSLALSHTMTQEAYASGKTSVRQDSSIDAGFFVSESLRGSLGAQRESDNMASANALFLMIGYRFGGGSPSPVRLKPAPFESI